MVVYLVFEQEATLARYRNFSSYQAHHTLPGGCEVLAAADFAENNGKSHGFLLSSCAALGLMLAVTFSVFCCRQVSPLQA